MGSLFYFIFHKKFILIKVAYFFEDLLTYRFLGTLNEVSLVSLPYYTFTRLLCWYYWR
jgi:hypothetical protein